LPHAIITQSDATLETGAGSMHARTGERACMVRGVGGVGTHVAQHWVQHQVRAVACGRQSTNKSRVNRLTDHS